jgi:hypothetical protein
MSDRITMLLMWACGFVVFVLAIPFLPRRDTSTPAQAVGLALSLALVWPLLLLVVLVRYAPLWYWLKWTDYREHLAKAKAEALDAKFRRIWQPSDRADHPELYEHSSAAHTRKIDQLRSKMDALHSNRLRLEQKLRD